jgi:hypothetical protein
MTTDQGGSGSLQTKLHPEMIRTNLIRSGLFLAAWELLKGQVQGHVRSFFVSVLNGVTTDYEKHVLARHKSVFEASLLWLIEVDAFTVAQAESVRALRKYRNEIAHEIPKMLIDPDHDVDIGRIHEMRTLIDILGRFWVRTDIDINPDFDGQTVDDADILSGEMLLMNHLAACVESA